MFSDSGIFSLIDEFSLKRISTSTFIPLDWMHQHSPPTAYGEMVIVCDEPRCMILCCTLKGKYLVEFRKVRDSCTEVACFEKNGHDLFEGVGLKLLFCRGGLIVVAWTFVKHFCSTFDGLKRHTPILVKTSDIRWYVIRLSTGPPHERVPDPNMGS